MIAVTDRLCRLCQFVMTLLESDISQNKIEFVIFVCMGNLLQSVNDGISVKMSLKHINIIA